MENSTVSARAAGDKRSSKSGRTIKHPKRLKYDRNFRQDFFMLITCTKNMKTSRARKRYSNASWQMLSAKTQGFHHPGQIQSASLPLPIRVQPWATLTFASKSWRVWNIPKMEEDAEGGIPGTIWVEPLYTLLQKIWKKEFVQCSCLMRGVNDGVYQGTTMEITRYT